MAIDLSALSAREALTAIYIGYYDRAADAEGIAFWEGVVDMTSLDLVAITTDFASQAETQSVHPFFMDPATNSAATFITTLYQNLFNRDPDADGLAFWSSALEDAVDGVEGAITVGEIITAIIEGAEDTPADPDDPDSVATNDRTTILNKIEVGLDWTTDSETAGIDYATNSAAQTSAAAIIEGVTDDPATVTSAKSTTDDFFADDGGDGGDTIIDGETTLLTSDTDVLTGTDDNDLFNAYVAQNPFAGGISNTLSSADRLDGGAGTDRLYAEITDEFVGVDGGGETDIQPRLTGIEEIDLEARDGSGFDNDVYVDGKNITGHDEIGSYYSDGDLFIENLTTLTDAGVARNTSEITITMDHTDNFNSDGDASDLIAYFDNDYLLAGQESEGEIRYFLLDEDAELAGLEDRLDNIDVDGLRFNIERDGVVTPVNLEAPEANDAGTHQGFVNALQDALQALIDDETLPAGTTLTLNPLLTDFTFLDDGSRSDDIPAIVLTTGDGSPVTATGFSRIADEIGEYDVYGRFESRNEVADQPVSVDIDLHKAGRGGEGGDLIVGGKAQNTNDDGIALGVEVFNINVLGAGNDDPTGMTKPSNVGTIASTEGTLRVVNIATDAAFASGTTFASLTVRNGFDEFTTADAESGDLQLVNADAFLGDLTLGDIDANANAGRITNLDTLTAQGGGDVEFNGRLDGTETEQAYSYTTGGGDDTITLIVDGDALDHQDSSINVLTGGGADSVSIDLERSFTNPDVPFDPENNQLNQVILDNIMVTTGEGNDSVNIDNVGDANISTGAGDDVVTTDGDAFLGSNAVWAFNHDENREAFAGASTTAPEDLPGEPLSLAYLADATVTVTLSGAGIAASAAGGGVMSLGAAEQGENGYEASATISSLVNGNSYYGDQRDVNLAIISAIENDPVLNALLSASIGANNTLVIASKTSGAFDPTDLRIDIAQETYTSSTNANAVAAEAQSLFSNSDLTPAVLFAGTTAGSLYNTGVAGADIQGDLADDWYDGLSTAGNTNQSDDNLHTAGSASISETDNVINGGSGDDVIVLSTDAVGTPLPIAPVNFTDSNATSLLNEASNETIEMSGSSIGDDTVMNFTSDSTEAGIDFLDFSAYLTSLEDTSAGGNDSADSNTPIAVTTDVDFAGVAANEVVIIDFTETATDTFAGLGASQMTAIFNGTGTTNDYGSFTVDGTGIFGQTDDAVINGAAKAIVMVQNVNNDGEYKVFELSWDASVALADQSFTVNDLGSLDFGETLITADDAFLVGSADYAALF